MCKRSKAYECIDLLLQSSEQQHYAKPNDDGPEPEASLYRPEISFYQSIFLILSVFQAVPALNFG